MRKINESTKRTILIIIITALCILALAGLIVYFSGYRYIRTDYAKFSGFTKDGHPVSGSIRYTDGIKGKLSTDKETGAISITYATGDVYTGDFKGIMRDGKGRIVYSNGDIYEGDFKEDMRTGSALITFADGSVYNGEILNGKPNGKGTYTFADSSWYFGEFKEGLKHGLGEYHAADGSYYYGRFVDDLKDGTDSYSFELSDGSMFKGECKLVFASGSTYSGDFVKDKRTGFGVYTWNSGEKYEGEFKNDLFDGQGTYHFSDSDIPPYTGLFEKGEIVDNTPAEPKENSKESETKKDE